MNYGPNWPEGQRPEVALRVMLWIAFSTMLSYNLYVLFLVFSCIRGFPS
jgi:hypothetical protein